jgi:soluble lytic murein transglycosylase
LKGDFEGARKKFAALADQKKGGTVRERARYWMAMSDLRLGRIEAARPLFTSIAADRSGSYYGTVARQRLAKLPAAVKPVKPAPAPVESPRIFGGGRIGDYLFGDESYNDIAATPDEQEASESEESLAAETETVVAEDGDGDAVEEKEDVVADLVQETGRSDVAEPAEIKAPANSRRFDRAKALLELGFLDDARWELFEIERRTRSREELKILITIYEEAQQWHRSSSIAHLRFAGQRVSQGMEGAKDLWQSAYPRAYEKELTIAARDNGLPEEFIWGIMKAESQYRRDAVSPVGALGLMQVMPGTGQKIADLRKIKNFSPAQLLQPSTAIDFGAYYLKRIGTNLDALIPLTAAAYNAGPHRVHSWLISFGNLEMDEFIEHIPFLETREYVRKVTSNALVYAQLYNGRKSLVDLAAPVVTSGRPEMAKREVWDPL